MSVLNRNRQVLKGSVTNENDCDLSPLPFFFISKKILIYLMETRGITLYSLKDIFYEEKTMMQKKTSVLSREVMPFLSMFVALILLTSIFDALLHYFDLIWVGRFLGIPGTLLILLSFIYSLRKRKVIQISNPKTLLLVHKTLTLTGR